MPCPLIIINKVAAKARHVWPEVEAALRQYEIQFDQYETGNAGDATVKTRHELQNGRQLVAVVGGDGTLSEAAEGFFSFENSPARPVSPEAVLAILPAGTGDDFARGLIGRRARLCYWLDLFIAYCRHQEAGLRRVDVLEARCDGYSKPFICINASTMGIGGETASRVAAQGQYLRRLPGEARFMMAAVGALAAWRERLVQVTVDDRQPLCAPMNLVAVANGLYAGGGMMLSPDARVDDGKLDVVTASGLNRAAVVRELPRLHSGGHVRNSKVKIMRGERVKIETFSSEDNLLIEADGNVRGKTPVEFRVLPGALRFVG
ncbi:MAG TPA: diacylglycerol kinase family protein [Pyrinomonadaceae bacterium]|nr:diacylglycerol kinase family protein [Pyrinomonadaceae bacterium]